MLSVVMCILDQKQAMKLVTINWRLSMTNNTEIVKEMMKAWEDKDEATVRSFLHDDYLGNCPMMGAIGADECVEFMKNCPYEGKSVNHEIIAEGDKVAQSFDWVITSPFKATVPMVEILKFDSGKVKTSKMYFDTALFPAEDNEQAA